MALNIVTGAGPRVGSSFVMQRCKANGLKIHGQKFLNGLLPKAGNPKGYYDLLPDDVYLLESGIAKVWPIALSYVQVPIDKLVILERKDKDKQLKSIRAQMKREPVDFYITAEELLELSNKYLTAWLNKNPNVDIRRYYTEDLDKDIKSIVKFLGD